MTMTSHVASSAKSLVERNRPAFASLASASFGYRFDIGSPGIERDDLAGIDVEARNGKAAARQRDRQRQADIAKADDTGMGLARCDFA